MHLNYKKGKLYTANHELIGNVLANVHIIPPYQHYHVEKLSDYRLGEWYGTMEWLDDIVHPKIMPYWQNEIWLKLDKDTQLRQIHIKQMMINKTLMFEFTGSGKPPFWQEEKRKNKMPLS